MRCRNCDQSNCIKKGKRNGKQRYHCKSCKYNFQLEYTYKAYQSNVNEFIKCLLKEGCGVRSISRIINISTKTVLSRILRISKAIKVPYFDKQGCKFEVDEMFIKIANGENQNWLIYGIERETKSLIGFVVGGRTKENISQLINKILLLNPKRIYTDRLNIYPSLIPKEIHKRFQYCTNKIERMNLTLRTHIKRLSRKTICFSRKQEYLEAHLKNYFWS